MRSRYKLEFYKMFLKKGLRDIPLVVASILVAAIICTGIIFGVSALYGETSGKIRVAYVFDDEDRWFKLGLNYMGGSINCDFVKLDEEDAYDALADNEVAAILIISNDEDERIEGNYFPITSIKFIHYDDDNFINSIFEDIVHAGLMDFMVLNTTSDTVRISYEDYVRDDMNELDDELLQYLLHRNRYYDRVIYSDSGDIPLKYFYISNAICFMVLLSASVIAGTLKNQSPKFISFVRRVGINGFDVFMSKYLSLFVFYSLSVLLGILIYQRIVFDEINGMGVLGSILAVWMLLFLIILIHELITDQTISTLVSVVVSIVLMFISGNIIPLPFLPEVFTKISEFILVKTSSRLLGQALWGRMNSKTVWFCVAFIGVTIVTIVLVELIRGKLHDKNC